MKSILVILCLLIPSVALCQEPEKTNVFGFDPYQIVVEGYKVKYDYFELGETFEVKTNGVFISSVDYVLIKNHIDDSKGKHEKEVSELKAWCIEEIQNKTKKLRGDLNTAREERDHYQGEYDRVNKLYEDQDAVYDKNLLKYRIAVITTSTITVALLTHFLVTK